VTATAPPVVRRAAQRLLPDRSRVLARLFVPGHEGFDDQESRTGAVLHRLLDLDESDVEHAYDAVIDRFAGRHHDLIGTFERHADALHDRLRGLPPVSDARRRLLGATFTSEYAIEGAALCNPSVVAHPDQAGVADGGLRLAMSVRAIGEGHSSSIGFRTGTVDAAGTVAIDPPSRFATTGETVAADHDVAAFRVELERLRSGGEAADLVFGGLGERCTAEELDDHLRSLDGTLSAPKQLARTIGHIRSIAQRTYGVAFEGDVELSARVLFPAMAAEARGMEDARFVRFVDDGGEVTYYASYTAYDGVTIRQQLLATKDFRAFTSSPLVGPAADNKGLALFPRRIGGRFYALSRADRESNAVSSSENLHTWPKARPCQRPSRSWELLQLGNCGSPIETDAGWLVLTHGVGPMRTYCIGAILLDLDDPTQIVGELPLPLLAPQQDEQDGYVPNVVYSCGGLVHAGTLVIPYGIGDAAVGVATVPVADVLAALEPPAPER
jgi:predicted GH43/DUF377 family glycosyl hydrolase